MNFIEMPRDILSDSLAVLRIAENEDEENWPLDEEISCRRLSDFPAKSLKKNEKDDWPCYYNYALGDGNGHQQNCAEAAYYHFKSNSLPATASTNAPWDQVTHSALRLSSEDIASQLTILDLACFKEIRANELTTCGWNKLNKLTIAPNVVAFTKRFNRVSFWTVQEVLNRDTLRGRAETIAHFVRVGRKLLEFNNLHSLFAIVSALRSASIYRLSKTWAILPKKDKQQLDKLADLFAETDNWKALREHMRSISLPCIPYLGIFLTDLVYIDIAHPAGSPHRASKMAVVLQTIERYQASEYNISPLPSVANYLNSVRYIEELQKFLEDDQYKLSLKLEPPSPISSCVGSKESVKDVSGAGIATPYNVSPSHRLGSGSLRIHGTFTQNKFIPTHRKCRSLGSKFRSTSLPRNFHKVNFGVGIFGKGHAEDKIMEKTPAGSVNLLDDTVLESPGPAPVDRLSMSLPQNEVPKHNIMECEYEGCVRRKTLLKHGRKPSLSSWQRFWLQITGNALFFYASKSFKGTSRGDFRSERCKVLCLDGWTVTWMQSDSSDAFQLVQHHLGTAYKFKTGSVKTAKLWVSKIEEVTNEMMKPLPANLMSFE